MCARRPEITMAMVSASLNIMYRSDADFVFTVTRDFVRTCQTPILVLRGGHGDGASRAEGPGEPLPVEGAQGPDSSRAAPRALLPAGASTCHSRSIGGMSLSENLP